MIHVNELTVQFGEELALQDVSLHIPAGQCILITGPSGCGKSTLAKALTGLIPHALGAEMTGSIEIAGLETQFHTIPELAQRVGLVFQNPSTQLFHLRVADEVAFGPRNLGLAELEVQSRTEWALEAVGITELKERNPAQLSGGQKQCVAIAAVLAMRPAVLVLDEPTASLDVPNTKQVLAVLRTLRQSLGMTIVLIEHRLSAVLPQVDRVLLLEAGRIVADGTPQEVLSDRERRRQLGLRRPAEEAMVSWFNLIWPNGQVTTQNAPLLTLNQISAGYNRENVIHDIDLIIYPGDVIALVGDNGAGKSTLAQVAAGLIKPTAGKVSYQGGYRPRPGLDVAMLFQNPADQVFTDSVDEEVRFGPENYGRFNPTHHQELLAETDLLTLRQRCPTMLSVGQQQRTTLAACIALQPRLVILDEPTLGQDWGHLQRLMEYLQRLNRQGTAVLLISHDYKLVFRYARRVVLMENGRIKMTGYFANKLSQKDKNHETNDT
ncbi:MAG: energy-coupling factor ABC transporter ATP-binding protein [Ardenticatenaceae bacterium]|nr:energy-coupling factor ABC transporter ATP-binding protein [Ardenticatenaceae bacterium]MCB9443472.1 energy-coupling factor ABC transporter ATP-binding protein [Ardenticatenaceae bacterium]